MAADALAVLDAAGVDAAHVMGVSMGGLLLVHLTTEQPDRIRSLTFVSAMSSDPEAGMGPNFFVDRNEDLLGTVIAAMGDVDDADRQLAADQLAAAERRARYRPEAVMRHMDAAFRLDWPTVDDLARIEVPTAVVHGREDRTLPVRHAESLAAGIRDARLVVREGMGHLPRPADWSEIARLQIDLAATAD